MAERIVLLPGDGIGPEVTEQARLVLVAAGKQAGLEFDFETELIGGCSIDAHGTPLRDEVIEACRKSRAVLLGAVGGPKWDDMPVAVRPEKGLLAIRKALGLYANLRPAAVMPALVNASALRPEIVEGVDLLVVRELTGGIYFGEPRGREGKPPGSKGEKGTRRAVNAMVYEEYEIERIARVAFEQARLRRRHVTHVHKANVLEVSQLWVEIVDEVAKDYRDVTLAHQLVDSCAMLLVQAPKRFDVIVTGNLFGDILSDEAAMITGSLGMLPSASLAEGGFGLFEPVHGSAPDIAGKDIANPLAAIQSVAMLLETAFGSEGASGDRAKAAAGAIRKAVADVLDAGHRSADLVLPGEKRETVGCKRMGALVLEALERG